MKVLITGAYGFIGSHVCREFLRNGHDVIGIDSVSYAADPKRIADLDIKVFEDDICNESNLDSIVRSNEIEWIVNTAAETHVDNSIRSSKEFIKSNIEGVRSILDVCRTTGTKLLQFSTDEVYGVPDGTPFNELSPLSPRNPYSSTKAAADHLIHSYSVTHSVKSLTIRPSNNFGPGQHDEKFIPTVIRSLRQDSKIPLYGDGHQEREWTSVRDTARATRFLVERAGPDGSVFNLSSGVSMKNIELVKKIVDRVKPDSDYLEHVKLVKDRPGHDRKYWISCDKILRMGFEFQDKMDEVIEEICR